MKNMKKKEKYLFEKEMKMLKEKSKLENDLKHEKYLQHNKYLNDLAEKDRKMFEMKINMQNIEYQKNMLLLDNEKLKRINQMKEEYQKHNQMMNNHAIPSYNNNTTSYMEPAPLDNYNRNLNNYYYF